MSYPRSIVIAPEQTQPASVAFCIFHEFLPIQGLLGTTLTYPTLRWRNVPLRTSSIPAGKMRSLLVDALPHVVIMMPFEHHHPVHDHRARNPPAAVSDSLI